MEKFLKASKNAIANLSGYEHVRVVLGNQTCDLDSAVCALVQGLFQYCDVQKENRSNVAVIPVMNILEKEFRVKTEVLYYLKHHKVPLSLLTFRDQIDLHALNAENKLELVLVDHHTLTDEDSSLANSVVEIIDHRPQDVAWTWTGKRINLQTVGSCATLVAKNMLEKHPDIVDSQVSNLLRGPILVDTCNFSTEADRATPTDFEVIQSLEEVGSLDTERDAVYREILSAKTDITGLTPSDLMIKDLKVVNGIPIAGFPMLVQNFVALNGAFEAVESFTKSRYCTLTILIGMDLKNNAMSRDIGVFSLDSNELENKIIRALTSSTDPNLDLVEENRVAGKGRNLVIYKQRNVRATRKQILPIIQSALAGCRC
ncbi:exopolyphosphatase PRUNE1 isoform X2 [Belonocnema kinseyi]|uniref:exopolyphosphatase PRUNE1 isoform X2 n=1 Tax=Belonocnema kinseyi TaxID=2817044 RepID=UPI00143D8256|nr:exopolyphosphatase PRUNE1 isoform X2 [Belonocnema kinseyi]